MQSLSLHIRLIIGLLLTIVALPASAAQIVFSETNNYAIIFANTALSKNDRGSLLDGNGAVTFTFSGNGDVTLAQGATQTLNLSASTTFTGGNDANKTYTTSDFTFTSDNTAVATVDDSGNITAEANGTCTITAKLKAASRTINYNNNDYTQAFDFTPYGTTIQVTVAEATVGVSSVTVGGNNVTADATALSGVEASYTITSTGALVITPTSGTVEYALSRTYTSDHPENFTQWTTTVPTIEVPSTPGASNYYYFRVKDGSSTKYYCIRALNNTAPTGTDLKVIDSHYIFNWTDDTAATHNNTSTKYYLYDRHMMLYDGSKEVRIMNNGVYLGNTGKLTYKADTHAIDDGNSYCYAKICVSGKGVLKIKIGSGGNPDGTSSREISVVRVNDDQTALIPLDPNYNPLGTGTVYQLTNTKDSPTDIYIYVSKSGGSTIGTLEWIPDDAEILLPLTADWNLTNPYELQLLNNPTGYDNHVGVKAIATSNGEDVSLVYTETPEVVYTVTQGWDCIKFYNDSKPTYEQNERIYPYNAEGVIWLNIIKSGKITIHAKINKSSYEEVEADFVINALAPPLFKVGDTNCTITEDPYVGTSIVRVEKTTATGTISTAQTINGTIECSAKQTSIAADPSTLTYSASSPNVEIPTAPGAIYYYYIKVTTTVSRAETSEYYIIEATGPATDNGIKVIDRHVNFGTKYHGTELFSSTNEDNITQNKVAEYNPYLYLHASPNRKIWVRNADNADEIVFFSAGNVANTEGILEIRVAGKGTLVVAAYTTNNRNTQALIIDKVSNGTREKVTEIPALNYVNTDYYIVNNSDDAVTTYYLYPNSTSTRINHLEWIPEVVKEVPQLTWSKESTALTAPVVAEYKVGDETALVVTPKDSRGNEISGLTTTYTVVAAGCGYPKYPVEGSVLPLTDGKLKLNNGQTGEFVIQASTAATDVYQPAASTILVKFEKRNPIIGLTEASGLTADSNDKLNLTTVVGGRSRIGTTEKALIEDYIELTGGQWGVIPHQVEVNGQNVDNGKFTFTADGKYATIDANGYIIGKEIGTAIITVTWEPTKADVVDKYTSASKKYYVEVKPGNLTLRFMDPSGSIGKEKTISPYVVVTNEIGEIVKGEYITYEFEGTTPEGTRLTSDKGAVVTGDEEGTATLVAHYTGYTEGDEITSTTPIYYTTNSKSGSATGNKTYALTIEDIPEGRLRLIENTSDFHSNNMAVMFWSNETNSSGADISQNRPNFARQDFYISSDNYFRLYPYTNETLVNTAEALGLQVKDKRSYVSFFAQGSATLEIGCYASVSRTLEVWAINEDDYNDYLNGKGLTNDADPNMGSEFQGLLTKVADIDCPQGDHTGNNVLSKEITMPGRNYYFIKTNSGGFYLSTIAWVNARQEPDFTVTPYPLVDNNHEANNTFTFDHDTHIVQITNKQLFQIKASTTVNGTTYTIYDSGEQNSGSITNNKATFSYASTNPEIVTVNPRTGVLTPLGHGQAKIYVTLEAGEIHGHPYGAQRDYVIVSIPNELTIVDQWFGESEIVYSRLTTPNTVWQNILTGACSNASTSGLHIHVHGTTNAEYTLASDDHVFFQLQDFDGNPIDKSLAYVYNMDGAKDCLNSKAMPTHIADGTTNKAGDVVFVQNGSQLAFTGDSLRVVARICGPNLVDQQAYYVVKVTNSLTIPTLNLNWITNEGQPDQRTHIKELNTPSTITGSVTPDKVREYYVLSDYQYKENANTTTIQKEPDVKMEFTIPASTTGITFKGAVVENLNNAPTTEITPTDGKYTITVTNPQNHGIKYVWVVLSNGTTTWNGFYKLNFMQMPGNSVSDLNNGTRTATFISKNTPGTYNEKIYYTYDSSTPTAESREYTAPITRTSNAVYNIIEAFTPTGGFTDGTFTFTTNPYYNIELEIIDPLVFEAKSSGNILKGNVENEMILPNTANTVDKALMRMMFGGDVVRIYKNTGTFGTGGVAWDGGHGQDSGIPYYVDIYKNYSQPANNASGHDSNPATEYNGDFGGVGSGLTPGTAAPYITPVSGAFFRFEPEYNGIVTVWLRQNGASSSKAWSNTHDNNNNEKTDQSKFLESYRLMRRPVYIMDETGTLMQKNTAPYNAEWEFEGTYDKSGTLDASQSYRYINGTVADVSLQSKLDRDFMWGWNNINRISDDKSRWYRAWYAMKFYNDRYDFNMSIPDYNDCPYNGNTYQAPVNPDNFDQFHINKGDAGDVNRIPIVDIVYCDNPQTDLEGQNFVQYGYELPMPNYVRYRIPVKAGKTYYLGGRQTKNSICAVKFDDDGTTANIPTYKLVDIETTAKENAWVSTLRDGSQINVEMDRKFVAGKWSPIVLPFSVSESRMRDIFGDDVVVITLDQYYKYNSGFEMPAAVYVGKYGVEADLMFTRHHYQMLYANTPAFILPTFEWSTAGGRNEDDITYLESALPKNGSAIQLDTESGKRYKDNVKFNRVTFEAGGVKDINIGSGYKVTGSYHATEAGGKDMYFFDNYFDNGSWHATIYHYADGVNMKATRCWIQKTAGQHAPALTHVGLTTFDGMELILDNMSSSILDISADAPANEGWYANQNVYNMQGMVVGTVTEATPLKDILNRLNRGIYIYQGRKLMK